MTLYSFLLLLLLLLLLWQFCISLCEISFSPLSLKKKKKNTPKKPPKNPQKQKTKTKTKNAYILICGALTKCTSKLSIAHWLQFASSRCACRVIRLFTLLLLLLYKWRLRRIRKISDTKSQIHFHWGPLLGVSSGSAEGAGEGVVCLLVA